MDPFEVHSNPNHVHTRSRLRMWWLTLARGYKIYSIARLPRTDHFGALFYATTWTLEKSDEDK